MAKYEGPHSQCKAMLTHEQFVEASHGKTFDIINPATLKHVVKGKKSASLAISQIDLPQFTRRPKRIQTGP
jgi:hypothetical protein